MNYQTRLILKKYGDCFSNLPVYKPIEMKLNKGVNEFSSICGWMPENEKRDKSIWNLQDPFSLMGKKPCIAEY